VRNLASTRKLKQQLAGPSLMMLPAQLRWVTLECAMAMLININAGQ